MPRHRHSRESTPSEGLSTAAGLAGVLVIGAVAAGAGLIAASRRRGGGPQPDDAPGFTARGLFGHRSFGKYAVVGRSVTVARPREELFAFWRDFANLASFMENVEQVQPVGSDGHCVWTLRAPMGETVDVETRVVSEEPGHLIAWRSVEGSDIDTEGRVTFEDAPGSRGTRVSVRIAYKPPAGELGRIIAKVQGREPEVQARHDLRRFRMLMETGEIATSARRRDQTRAHRQAEKHQEEENA
jgi:uncharacterized membrane protein